MMLLHFGKINLQFFERYLFSEVQYNYELALNFLFIYGCLAQELTNRYEEGVGFNTQYPLYEIIEI